MRRAVIVRTAPAIVSVVVLALGGLRAAEPGIVAIRNARIVTAAGAPIERGTVVVRDGVITGVGVNVAVPPEATVIEGAGFVVYPGLIDLGHTSATDPLPTPQPLQGTRTTAQVEQWKRLQILRPQVRAADTAKIDDAGMTRWAAGGVTSVLAVPPGDVVSGQSALISTWAAPESPQIGNITQSRRSQAVLRSPVALHVSLPARPRIGTNAYPVSLIGVIAFVRQAFVDAQYYGVQDAHHVAPDDPVLAAMQPALTRRTPVAFEANSEREILRALRLAREFNLDPIVTGGREAPAVAADLVASKTPVILSLNYPTRPRAIAPDADEPLRELQARANAPAAAAALSKAGVRFGLASAGIADAAEFRRNANKAVAAGLSEDAAIRALTIDAAALAGVGDRLGSIEPNKIGNLVITDGPLLNDKTKILHVLIGGRQVPIDPPSASDSSRNTQR